MSRILFADRNGFTQRMGIQFLSAEGHDVVTASAGEDALRYIQQQRPDIAILDTQMSSPSGLELCWRIKSDSTLRDTKVVLLNRVADPIPDADAEKAGSDAMLFKPLDGPMLVGTVSSLIEKMRAEISSGKPEPDVFHSNGFGSKNGEISRDTNGARVATEAPAANGTRVASEAPAANGTRVASEAPAANGTNGTNGLTALGLAVSAAVPANAQAGTDVRRFDAARPAAAKLPEIHNAEPEGVVSTAMPGRPVVRTVPAEQTDMTTETEVRVDHSQESPFSSAVDFAAIVDEALRNSAVENEMQRRIEEAIHRILRPAVSAVAENLTQEIFIAHHAQRRVEEAVNGLLLPAIVSIADGSHQGVLAAFRSK